MLLWTIQISIMSIILIFLVHYLFTFFKATLTVPKIKDLVYAPAQKYEAMMNIIANSNSNSNSSSNEYNKREKIEVNQKDEEFIYKENFLPSESFNSNTTSNHFLEKPDVDSMKNELKHFLKNKLTNISPNINATDISSLDSYSSSSSNYSAF